MSPPILTQRVVTNANQTQINGVNFDGFGNTIGTFGSSTSSYMYGATSGYRTEGDAGLSQVGARYYDAQVGRFVTRDTYLNQHPYLYCDHDPINKVDPSGHDNVSITLSWTFIQISASYGEGGFHASIGVGVTAPGPGISWSPDSPNPKGAWGWDISMIGFIGWTDGNQPLKPGAKPYGGIGWGGGIDRTYQFF